FALILLQFFGSLSSNFLEMDVFFVQLHNYFPKTLDFYVALQQDKFKELLRSSTFIWIGRHCSRVLI
ncbi:MAG TPA: hypothetical protein PKM56_15115, partial [Candidatus Rifleibacterium sp.]|nr:hypothetical protein [Candidatus Rifleibacterium sp.]